MKLNISSLSRILILIVFSGLSVSLFAQTMNDAGDKFNNAAQQLKAKDYTKAIPELEACINICKTIGAEGVELRGKAEKQLANAYYKKGISLYKAKKFDDAITTFVTAQKKATELGQPDIAKKAKSLIPNVYYTKSSGLLKSGQLDEALAAVNKTIEMKPNFYKAYLNQGLIYKDKGDLTKMKVSLDKCIELAGVKAKAQETVTNAKSAAAGAFTSSGIDAVKAGSFDKAISYFNTALSYEDNGDTYYFLTTAYNGSKKWDDAIASSTKALAMMTDGKEKVYFEQGRAFEGKGDAASACASYKKVTSGPNAEAAKYQIEQVLKCQ